ncbi:MAG: hypothetical protein GXO78_02410 [Calditrichaeota bacterium]|nr:hypothetical protein [Calditrichota bacterium]
MDSDDSLEGTPTELRQTGSMPGAEFFFGLDCAATLFWSGQGWECSRFIPGETAWKDGLDEFR